MKKLFTILLLFVSTQLFADIAWQKDLTGAFDLAKKENKVVMLMVEGKHCRWCKKMKHRTLADENVSKRLEPYIAVKIMREEADNMQDLPMVNGVPTIFFMTAEKKVIESIVGYFNVEDFLSYIDDVEKKVPLKKKSEPLTLQWFDDIDEAFAEAKNAHKKVMVLVEDEACRWCKKMKADALSNEAVKEKLNAYVLLKIDRIDQEDMEALEGLRGPIPSFHLFDTQKKALDALAGYYDTDHFLGYLNELSQEYK